MSSVYLDHAATSPVDPEVLEAMLPFLRQSWGNPSSSHSFGRAARAGLELARHQLAECFQVEPGAVVFTSGGTEADNLAVLGTALAARDCRQPIHIATSTIEHKAIEAAARAAVRDGGMLSLVPVDSSGLLDPARLSQLLEQQPTLLSVIWVNNELGVIQPIETIAEQCRLAGVPFHSDAIQAVGKIPLRRLPDGLELISISGHKIGAPKGIGALIVRNRQLLEPILYGGGQQAELRPGTENVAGAVALGCAVQLAFAGQQALAERLRTMREGLERKLTARIPELVINGAEAPRAPQILSISIPGTDTQTLQMHLDLAGFAVSGGSACSTGSVEPSRVILALGHQPQLARGTIRISLGHENTPEDLDQFAAALPAVVERVRNLNLELGRV